jgi:hypothetical protein
MTPKSNRTSFLCLINRIVARDRDSGNNCLGKDHQFRYVWIWVRNILKHACVKKHKESNGDCDGLWESHTGPGCGLGKVLWSDLNDKRIFEGKVFFCKQLC